MKVKRKILRSSLFLILLLLCGSPLWAQQAGLPYNPYNPSMMGQAPYLGAPTYNPNSPSYLFYPPQSRYFQGMLMPNQPPQPDGSFYGPQQAPPGFVRSGQRSCAFSPPQAPSVIQPEPPVTTPVQGLWPGMEGATVAQEIAQTTSGQPISRSAVDGSLALLRRQPEARKEQPKQEESAAKKNSPSSFVSEPVSSIEASFNFPVFPNEPISELRQFGYPLFASPISTFAPVEDIPVGPDYVLGPGDDLLIRVWGSMDYAFLQNVDRNGEISLPNVGPVRVWGMTFKDAAGLIRQHFSQVHVFPYVNACCFVRFHCSPFSLARFKLVCLHPLNAS